MTCGGAALHQRRCHATPHQSPTCLILDVAGVGDLERLVARLHCTSRGACARDAVVLYEDAARRRVAALVTALRGLQACCTLPKGTRATRVCVYVYCLGL